MPIESERDDSYDDWRDVNNNGNVNWVENQDIEDDYDSYEDWFKNIEENKVFSKEEILTKLKSSEDINKTRKAVKEILWKMEWRYVNYIKEYYWIRYNNWLDWRIDVDNPKSVFEKEYMNILEELNGINQKIDLAEDEVNLLNYYENLSEKLYNLQEQSSASIREDLSDWILSSRELVWYQNVMNIIWNGSQELFDTHDNRVKFQELLKKKSDIQLIWECFNIDEWFWAFEDSYKELLRRLNWENLFKKFDDLTSGSAYEKSRDWTKEITMPIVLKGLFARWKISDFEKWLNWYEKKDELLNNINNSLANDSKFVLAFLSHIDKVQECEVFQNSVKFLEENSEIYNKYLDLKKWYDQKNIDVLNKDKDFNFVGLYDNESDWWWSTYFYGDSAVVKDSKTGKMVSKKYPGFALDEKESTENNLIKKVVLKKWNDSMTFVLLKQKEKELPDGFDLEDMYKMALWWLDKNDYNVFALRWHCYTTTEMASALGDLEMVWENDVIIDWGCWNYDNIGDYMDAGIKWEIFAYRWQWRWNSTEAFIKKLYQMRNNDWDYKSFLEWIEKQKISPDSWHTQYIWEQIITPNSAYSLYRKAEYELNKWNDIALANESWEDTSAGGSWEVASVIESWEESSVTGSWEVASATESWEVASVTEPWEVASVTEPWEVSVADPWNEIQTSGS